MDNQLNHKLKLPKLFWIFIVLILLASDVFLIAKYKALQEELKETQSVLKVQNFNEKVLDFVKLFIAEVLKAETEINFETRLKLENAVRNLGDAEILEQWNKFVNSKTETEAQNQVKNLLELLVKKIKA